MSQIVTQRKIDDISKVPIEGEATEVTLIVNGLRYDLDLNETHAAEFLGINAVYLKAAKPEYVADAPEIREWAKHRGISVSTRGRLPQEVVSLYQREHTEIPAS